jgi:hypothetical protein
VPEPSLTRPRLIICESRADAGFLRALIAARGIEAYDIRNTQMGDTQGGNSRFGPRLGALEVDLADGPTTHVLIVADADADAEHTFQLLLNQLKNLKQVQPGLKIGHPTEPFVTAAGTPSLAIYLIPGVGACGNLECLAYRAAKGVHPQNAALVEGLATAAGVDQWSVNSQAKMKLKTLFACTHSRSPDIGLGNLWSQGGDYLINLQDPALDDLASYLDAFGT